MLLDVVDQAVLILTHFEEVIVLADAFDWPFTIRAEASLNVFLCPESFVECAIPPSITIFIYQIFTEKILKILLND